MHDVVVLGPRSWVLGLDRGTLFGLTTDRPSDASFLSAQTNMKSYRELDVWKLSRAFIKDVYLWTSTFPKSETYGLAAQMRRGATSIMSNIAEGQGRWGANDQCHLYIIARGSLLELETQFFIASDLEYVSSDVLKTALARTETIGRKLTGLIRSTRDRSTEDRGPRTEDQ